VNKFRVFNFKIQPEDKYLLGDAEYNPGIFNCPECNEPLDDKTILGYDYLDPDMVVVIKECPACFKKSYYHVSLGDYETYCWQKGIKFNI
jgi:hypothetical protein